VRAVLVLVLGFAAAACRSSGDASTSNAAPPVTVETAVVTTEDVDVTVRAVGTLAAEQAVDVAPRRSGHVLEVPLREGTLVAAGTVLVRLDDRDERARLDQARAAAIEAEVRLRNAARQFERTRQLRDQGIAAQQQYDDLKADFERQTAGLDVAKASVAIAEAQLADTVVLAPFDGIVGRRLVDVGTFVKEGQTLTTIVDADPVEIVFAVPERHAPELRTGQAVSVTVTSHGERPFPGTVSFVDPKVDPVNRTVTVKAVLPNADLALRPGQFATVALTLAHHANAIVVPEEALVPSGEDLVVYVVQNGQAESRPVTVGVRLPGRAEITTGLASGDVVVRAGQEKLRIGVAAPVAVAAPAVEG
jgi:membrane fusion protein (multidrug efflux system)